MINKAIIVGRLTSEPEMRKTSEGKSVVAFTLANDRIGKDAGADFPKCVCYGGSADYLYKYGFKGALVAIEGRTQTRSYESQHGKVYVQEILCNEVNVLQKNPNLEEKQAEEIRPKETPVDDYFDNIEEAMEVQFY